MRKLKTVIANTRVDRHYERLAHEGLGRMVADINSGYMPFWDNHDPRLPPLGRVAEARLEDDDSPGELRVVGVVEIFEPGDQIPFNSSRKMFMRSTDPERLTLSFDRSYRDATSQALIRDIGDLLNSDPTPEVKKAVDPLSVLTIAGTFIAGGISGGFLKELGADGYEALKEKLKLLLARRKG